MKHWRYRTAEPRGRLLEAGWIRTDSRNQPVQRMGPRSMSEAQTAAPRERIMEDRGLAAHRIGAVALGVMCVGCVHDAPDLEPYLDRPLVVAVAPALNHSGSSGFDGVRVADLMVSELGHFGGVKTLPVNRFLAQLGSRHTERIESPQEAMELARRIGADRLMVFAITEYDPYQPPVVGITAQFHGSVAAEDRTGAAHRDAQAEPAGGWGAEGWPCAEVQRVFKGAGSDRPARDPGLRPAAGCRRQPVRLAAVPGFAGGFPAFLLPQRAARADSPRSSSRRSGS